MVAPRPILLMYGAIDQYNLRAPLQKPHLYDEIKPFFKLYGEADNLAFYEDVDPGTHNYELASREKSYAFFTRHFKMPVVDREVPVDAEVKKYDELVVGLPKDNLTILKLAKKIAAVNQRSPIPANRTARLAWARASRARLKQVVRYKPVALKHAWPLFSTKNQFVDSLAYRLQFNNDLSATAVWLKPLKAPDSAPIRLLLDDGGTQSIRLDMISDKTAKGFDPAHTVVARHIRRGDHVVAVNLVFTGDASPDFPKTEPVHVPAMYRELLTPPGRLRDVIGWLETRPPSALYGLLLSAIGDRPLGMQAAQLIGIAHWLRATGHTGSVSLETSGIRNQVTALVACALDPTRFSELTTRNGMSSLQYLLDNFVRYQEAPDLFCLDLYKYFDIDVLAGLAHPTKVKAEVA